MYVYIYIPRGLFAFAGANARESYEVKIDEFSSNLVHCVIGGLYENFIASQGPLPPMPCDNIFTQEKWWDSVKETVLDVFTFADYFGFSDLVTGCEVAILQYRLDLLYSEFSSYLFYCRFSAN